MRRPIFRRSTEKEDKGARVTDENHMDSAEETLENTADRLVVTQLKTVPKPRRRRRKAIQIKLEVLQQLKELPMSAYELSSMIGMRTDAIEKYLQELADLGKVECYRIGTIVDATGKPKLIWRLKQH